MCGCSIFILPVTRMKDRVFFFYFSAENSWNRMSRNNKKSSRLPQNCEQETQSGVRLSEALDFFIFFTPAHHHPIRKLLQKPPRMWAISHRYYNILHLLQYLWIFEFVVKIIPPRVSQYVCEGEMGYMHPEYYSINSREDRRKIDLSLINWVCVYVGLCVHLTWLDAPLHQSD